MVRHVEADAVVAHPEETSALRLPSTDHDLRLRHLPGELERVTEHVAQHLGHTLRIGLHRPARHIHRHLHAPRLDLLRALGNQRPHQRLEVHPSGRERAALQARVGEQILNQLAHLIGCAADGAQELSPLRIQLIGVILQQQTAVAVDAPQRRLQIVGDGVGERLQLLIRRLQRRRPLGHPLLQHLGVALDLLVEESVLQIGPDLRGQGLQEGRLRLEIPLRRRGEPQHTQHLVAAGQRQRREGAQARPLALIPRAAGVRVNVLDVDGLPVAGGQAAEAFAHPVHRRLVVGVRRALRPHALQHQLIPLTQKEHHQIKIDGPGDLPQRSVHHLLQREAGPRPTAQRVERRQLLDAPPDLRLRPPALADLALQPHVGLGQRPLVAAAPLQSLLDALRGEIQQHRRQRHIGRQRQPSRRRRQMEPGNRR